MSPVHVIYIRVPVLISPVHVIYIRVPILMPPVHVTCIRVCLLRESHAVILRDRVVPASQVPFPGEPSGEPGNGT